MKRFLRENRVEMIVLVLAAVSIFVLVGDFGWKGAVRTGSSELISGAQNILVSALDQLVNYLIHLSTLDLIGWVIIIATVSFVYARIRYRYRSKSDLIASTCPSCNSSIKRIHRSSFDRFLGATIMPDARRYKCTNRSCGWQGLRRQHYRHEMSSSEGEASLRS